MLLLFIVYGHFITYSLVVFVFLFEITVVFVTVMTNKYYSYSYIEIMEAASNYVCVGGRGEGGGA